MQIVIDIDDDLYTRLFDNGTNYNLDMERACTAIRNGIPLPKGHGRLIDADVFLKDNEAYTGWILDSSDWGGQNAYKDTLEDLVNEAPTIIEADKAESEVNAEGQLPRT